MRYNYLQIYWSPDVYKHFLIMQCVSISSQNTASHFKRQFAYIYEYRVYVFDSRVYILPRTNAHKIHQTRVHIYHTSRQAIYYESYLLCKIENEKRKIKI